MVGPGMAPGGVSASNGDEGDGIRSGTSHGRPEPPIRTREAALPLLTRSERAKLDLASARVKERARGAPPRLRLEAWMLVCAACLGRDPNARTSAW